MESISKGSLTISLPLPDLNLVNRIADQTGKTRSDVVLTALRAHYVAMRVEYEERIAQVRAPRRSRDLDRTGGDDAA